MVEEIKVADIRKKIKVSHGVLFYAVKIGDLTRSRYRYILKNAKYKKFIAKHEKRQKTKILTNSNDCDKLKNNKQKSKKEMVSMKEHYANLNDILWGLGFKTPYHFYKKISFNGGNFFKYVYRYDKKQQALSDLLKAREYFYSMVGIGFSNFDAIPLNNKKLLVFENLEEKIWSKYNFLCKWGWTKMFGCFNPLKKIIRKNITFILLQIEKATNYEKDKEK